MVSAPWPLYRSPSIQLGTLKASLKEAFPGLQVDTHHFYLEAARAIGYEVYQAISQRIWLAECVYGSLLYPEHSDRIARLFENKARRSRCLRGIRLESIRGDLQTASQRFLERVDWASYDLVGFSVCLCQLTSSLYFIRAIREHRPNLPLVIGGSGLGGNPGLGFFDHFPEVDAVVVGEGETPLRELIAMRLAGADSEEFHKVAAVVTRKNADTDASPTLNQKDHLRSLPIPDYSDYFQTLKDLGPDGSFSPVLPVEMSRGCWWRQREISTRASGCAFCNLNLQWNGYRSKEPDQVVSEIDSLSSKHRVLKIAFMDNTLPPRLAAEAFTKLASLHKDFQFFAELRAATPAKTLRIMRAAGLQDVQIGIEALSTSLLRRMSKGASTMDNLRVMRDCEELGLINHSNLILEFPGSGGTEVQETLHALEFALPFRPLKPVQFWLGRGSPIHATPLAFGIRSVFNHPAYAKIFPADICRSVSFMILGYRGQIKAQRELWKPVRRKLKEWRHAHSTMRRMQPFGPLLGFRDGGDFLIITRQRPDHLQETHRLHGRSREVYLHCRNPCSLPRLQSRFPQLSEDRLVAFLQSMVAKRLMFQEGGRYLSLASPIYPRHGKAIRF